MLGCWAGVCMKVDGGSRIRKSRALVGVFRGSSELWNQDRQHPALQGVDGVGTTFGHRLHTKVCGRRRSQHDDVCTTRGAVEPKVENDFERGWVNAHLRTSRPSRHWQRELGCWRTLPLQRGTPGPRVSIPASEQRVDCNGYVRAFFAVGTAGFVVAAGRGAGLAAGEPFLL